MPYQETRLTGEEKYGRERLTAEITSAKARLVGFFREFCLDLSIAGTSAFIPFTQLF